MTYGDLGGVGLRPVYVEAIKRDCPRCTAKTGELCDDENHPGQPRRRPHGSRMVAPTGGSCATEAAATS